MYEATFRIAGEGSGETRHDRSGATRDDETGATRDDETGASAGDGDGAAADETGATGDSAYAAATGGTDARIELWCNDHCDLLHVTAGAASEAASDVLAYVREQVGVRERLRTDEELVVVTDACLKDRDPTHIEQYLETHDCLLVPPLRYADGAKYCRLLALDPAALTACYRDLLDDGFRVSVESKREVGSVTPDAPLLTLEGVLPTLTARQHEVFTTAYERGYYEIPRETSTTAIADAVGVERRTAEEHLRRAENKLVASLVPYLR